MYLARGLSLIIVTSAAGNPIRVLTGAAPPSNPKKPLRRAYGMQSALPGLPAIIISKRDPGPRAPARPSAHVSSMLQQRTQHVTPINMEANSAVGSISSEFWGSMLLLFAMSGACHVERDAAASCVLRLHAPEAYHEGGDTGSLPLFG